MTAARKPNPRPDSTTTRKRARPDRGRTSPNPSVKKVVPLRYMSVDRLGVIPVTFRAEPAPYCIRPNPRTKPTAHTARRISKEIGPKTPIAVSRILREGISPQVNFQMLHEVR